MKGSEVLGLDNTVPYVWLGWRSALSENKAFEEIEFYCKQASGHWVKAGGKKEADTEAMGNWSTSPVPTSPQWADSSFPRAFGRWHPRAAGAPWLGTRRIWSKQDLQWEKCRDVMAP